MQQPRCVFLVGSLVLLVLMLLAFTGYHVYLVSINQTTNERYKLGNLYVDNNNAGDAGRLLQAWQEHSSFYNRGLLLNLFEVFFPQFPSKKGSSPVPAKEGSQSIQGGRMLNLKAEAVRQKNKRKDR